MDKKERLITNNFYFKLLKNIKRSIREVQGPEDPEIRRYYRSYASFLEKCYFKEVSYKDLIESAKLSDFLLVGDFHTLFQAQREFIKVMALLRQAKIEFDVGLEMVHKKNQKSLDNYLEGKIGEKEFLEETDYFKTWGFDFLSYGNILKYLKSNRVNAYAINKEGSLVERDNFIAEVLDSVKKEKNKKLIVVLIGDLHLAQNHLPEKLKKKGYSSTILYQNSESVTKKLMINGQNPYALFKLKEKIFLVNNTPPWIKMQSNLTYLEHGAEAMSIKYGYATVEKDEAEIDFSATVQNYIKALKDIFTLHNKKDDDFEIYTMYDLSFLNSSYFKKEPGKTYASLIRDAKSIYIDKHKLIYTPYPDVNHTVEEAMHYLMEKDLPLGDSEEIFWERIHYFFSGFLASKVINPMRQTFSKSSLNQFFQRIESAATEKDKKYLRNQIATYLAMADFFEYINKKGVSDLAFQGFAYADPSYHYELSRQIGYQIAEIMFKEYNEERISGWEIKHIIFTNDDIKGFCLNFLKKAEDFSAYNLKM